MVDRCGAYGIEARTVDGNDAVAVAALTAEAAARCRAGDGPFLIEAETYRWHGHYEGDSQPYKPEDEATSWRDARPARGLRRAPHRGRASLRGAPGPIRAEAPRRVEASIERARTLPAPDPEEAYADVFGN